MFSNLRISDTREVSVRVSGQEPMLTPKGNRPIDPVNIRVCYGIEPDTGSVWHIRVTVNGQALFPKKGTTVVQRNVELDHAPDWVNDVVDCYRPDQS